MSKIHTQIHNLIQQSNQEYVEAFIIYLASQTKIPKTKLREYLQDFKSNLVSNSKKPVVCKHIFKKGNKANTECGKKLKDGETFCTKHSKSKNSEVTEPENIFEKDVLLIEDENDETNWEEEEEEVPDFDEDEEDI